ncbi:helix-turn-helix transcriptional regulator [Agromyces sp. G08B096]|uniref:Helix-turn-helix transcriptional regulator n=1 Tax=Agromyces sp. G08B096 TaxID=3156399 RepID=A0AAU7W8U0_9MICO
MTSVDSPEVGSLLRSWRERRRLSQLQLSSLTGISARHLSFVETGKSAPSRDMINRLAANLELPLRERNQLLHAGGFAPRHPQRSLAAPELLAVSAAFQQILDAHVPHPALLVDRWWDIVDRNTATDLLLHGCADHLLEPPVNAIRLSLHPEGLAPRIRNLGQWRSHLLGQLGNRAERTGDRRLRDLLEEAESYPGELAGRPLPTDVVVPLEVDIDGRTLRMFSISSAVESALDVTIDELRLEAFYPMDALTSDVLRGAVQE